MLGGLLTARRKQEEGPRLDPDVPEGNTGDVGRRSPIALLLAVMRRTQITIQTGNLVSALYRHAGGKRKVRFCHVRSIDL